MWFYNYLIEKKLNWKLVINIFILSSLITGCAESIPSPETQRSYLYYRQILDNATNPLPAERLLNNESQPMPIFKDISPLRKTLTVAFYQEHYENVLFFIAYEVGLNLIIDPEARRMIPPERERITLQMKNQPAEEILKKVCELLDLAFKIERGILHITPFEEKIFNLGFIAVLKESRANLGGDVLGTPGQAGLGGAPIRGEYTINAQVTRESLDIYRAIEETISAVKSERGLFKLNRLTGTLYVRDRPSKINTIGKIVEKLSNVYKRQIIIDAQIIEIELAKEHNLGVDWFEITNFLLGNNRISLDRMNLGITTRSDQPSFAMSISGLPNINILLNLLKTYGELKIISNPKIRVLHSQPALISVGTSQSFIQRIRYEGNQTSIETSSVFDGILLGITPFIVSDDEIILHIVPIKTDLIDLREVKIANYLINLPRVNLREMTSIIRAKPNDLIIIGGLILEMDKGAERKVGIPILSEIFKRTIKNSNKAELVILLRLITA